MRATFVFIIIFWKSASAVGQSFIADAPLQSVHEDGFYKIPLTPDLSPYLNTAFTNIRIYDEGNNEVPFLFQEEASHTTQEFKEYEILEKRQVDGCCTRLVLHNPQQNLLNNIKLIVKNADVTKEAILLGGDDNQHWFALKQRFLLYPTANTTGTAEIKIVDFPLTDYIYYSLQINDSTTAPLNIIKAGYFEVQTEDANYTEVPVERLDKKDSLKQKKTYLHLQFDTLRTLDRLELSMKGSPYYLRKANLYQQLERALKKGGKEKYYDLLQEIELSSKRPTNIELPAIKVDDLLVVIENEDNPALQINFCKAHQRNRHMIAYLKKGGNYFIKIGDDRLPAPVYDLSFFKDSIPSGPYVLAMGQLNVFPKQNINPSFTFFSTKIFIWAAVILVIVILGFMSVRMLNDASSERNKKIE